MGEATWYGEAHQGKRTASGEPFDLHQHTAAHRSLPFGTRVRVTLISTGKSVEVRINDRNGGREIIDVSKSAAEAIGLTRVGRGQVRVEVL
ncbi:MAG: septal ring lytic transglycosylase RlpA family protein [bacterium]